MILTDISNFKQFSHVANNRLNKYTKNEQYFSKINSEDKAYFLGWIASDGHIRRKRFTIKLKYDDSYVLEVFSKSLSSNLPVHCKKYNNKEWGILDVSSIAMTKDIIKALSISFGKKDSTISMPKLNNKLKWCFLRGLFEGDGHIRKFNNKIKRPRIIISSVSNQMKIDIKNFCNLFGIDSCIPKNNKSIQISGRHSIKFIGYVYDKCNDLKLERKYNECMSWINNWKPKTRKLNIEIADEIRLLKSSGIKIKNLSKMFHVNNSSIHNILNNKSYKPKELS